jgi:hypothetical protein
MIFVSMTIGLKFYQNTTQIADKVVEELRSVGVVHGTIICDNKNGQEKDICYVVLATMHPEQDLSALCSRINSDFYKFTCHSVG